MPSRPCEECNAVKRCAMYTDRDSRPVYLCRSCARDLNYVLPSNSIEREGQAKVS